MKCNKFYDAKYVFNSQDLVPKCNCGGIIKPDVVLYEEPLDDNIMTQARKDISQADMLIIAGTSLAVYPAAGLIDFFRGNYLVLINKSSTPLDYKADLVINDSLGKVFGIIDTNI